MIRTSHLTIVALVFAFSGEPARAEVRPHPLFSDGVVLQRGQKVPVWGTAAEGQRVTVTVQDRQASAVCRDGRWRVELPPLAAGGPIEMTIAGSNTVHIRNVLVGEVWVASGQSNMDMTLASCAGGAETIASSANPRIRLCKVPRQAADEPPATIAVAWRECGPKTVANFSGVAYYFARALEDHLRVPIGIIDAAYGGTPAEAWMSPAAVRSRPEFKSILDEYAEQVRDSPRAMAQHEQDLAAWERAAAEAKKQGLAPPAGRPQLPLGPFNFRRPSGLYHGMVQPLVPFAMRGVIWYQGERNSPRAYQYRTLLPALIADWRQTWGQGDFPFLLVQLAPFGKPDREPRDNVWAELREAQFLTSKSVPRTAMAVITDAGDEVEIHAPRKEPVGQRLAIAARAVAYGEPIEYSGPSYRSYEVQGNRMLLAFDHVGGGLECRGERLTGFVICGRDRKFVNAEARIVGERVEVTSPFVAEPVAVRFGWAYYPVVNFWNRDGLPASPFRTDDFPLLTQPQATR